MAESSIVKRRCVISISDFYPTNVAEQFTLFQRGLQRFADTWKVSGKVSPFATEADGAVAVWQIETTGPNWKVETEYRLWNWSDLARKSLRPWNLKRVWLAVRAIADFIWSRACWQYLRANRRFGLLFLYPLLVVLFFAFGGLWLAVILGNLDVPSPTAIGFLVAFVLLAAFVQWVDPDIMPRVANMWIYLRELIHLENSETAERLGTFSRDLIALLRREEFDEVIVVGHGLGAAVLPVVLDRTFWDFPEFGKKGGQISLITIESLMLAVGTHPEGSWLVGPVSRIARDRMVYWVEYQSSEGVLGFSGCNPVRVLTESEGKPEIQTIQLSEMNTMRAKQGFFRSIFRRQLQPVLANNRRYFYDFFMICCGPFDLKARARSPEFMVSAFDQQGKLLHDIPRKPGRGRNHRNDD